MPTLGPRLVIAGTASGVGKTTVATGLMAALGRRGLSVTSAKVGPDFIDPGYHSLATGRPGRNLDAWMCGAEAMAPLAARAGVGGDVLVVEGVMGLFDGAVLPGPSGSTALVAGLLDAPVVLVVDSSSLSSSVAALVHGYACWDRSIRVGGVVLNRVGSDSHEQQLRDALRPLGIPVLGALRRDQAMSWRDRHLGLVPVVEQEAEVRRSLERLAAAIERGCDVDGLLTLARSVGAAPAPEPPAARPAGRARVAVATGRSFSFYYQDNLEILTQAGASLESFDPRTAAALPDDVDALYAGGGFPEVFAGELAGNRALLDDVRRRMGEGLVTWAECGGLLWLARSLDGLAMAGVVPTDARMTGGLALGYRLARPTVDNPLAPRGAELRGHEFHYSALQPEGTALEWVGRSGPGRGGFATPTLLASYVHLHLAADPRLAERFVATATRSGPGLPL